MTVLVVEDESGWQERFYLSLSPSVNVLAAASAQEARHLFAVTPNLAAIVVDGCLSNNALDSSSLIQEIRGSGYRGPMIAISSNLEHCKTMRRIGCDYDCPKILLPATLKTILQNP